MHAADNHDLIRVHGARVNNLKDVSVELPKRRLTVFTGVSGSGKWPWPGMVNNTIISNDSKRQFSWITCRLLLPFSNQINAG